MGIMLNFSYEDVLLPFSVIGIDEAGCGPWAGPVYAAAVHFKIKDHSKFSWLEKLDDSKKLSKKKRNELFTCITESTFINFGIGSSSAKEIDSIGLSMAISNAIHRALTNIKNHQTYHLLIDGIRKPKLDHSIHMLIKGDQKSPSIAAASILAKVSRDLYMEKQAAAYPMYNWHKNAGYGTTQHKEAIQQFGICHEHRKSFKPILDILNKKQIA